MVVNRKQPSATSLYSKQIALLLISIIASAAIIILSYSFYSEAKFKNEKLSQGIDNTNRDIAALQNDINLFNAFSAPFSLLESSGVFAEEDRLLWSETLKFTAERKKLPNLRYAINPQNIISNIGAGYGPNLALRQSIMQLNAGLAHEGDFLDLMIALENLPALSRIEECKLEKAQQIKTSLDNANIELSCKIAWFTLAQAENNQTPATVEDIGDPI